MGEFEDRLNGILNNPKEMEKIMALARNFMGSSGSSPPPTGGPPPAPPTGGLNLEGILGGLDPGLMSKLATGLSAGIGSASLLQAITPHLKESRRGQLKRAITIAQVVRAARAMFD